jgi:hypothetical protein
MANKETSELGGEGVAVCSEGLILWMLTPVLRKCGVMVKGGSHFSFSYQDTFLKGSYIVGGKRL